MSLSAGTRLGAYEVLALIGAGGMGEVYRARDTKLNRDVALKVLPDLFASDPDRLARFKREAQVLASLNHVNIAAIYGLEEVGDVRALVLELVEGPTLADLITGRVGRALSGPPKMPDPTGSVLQQIGGVLAIAKQIVAALEAAHEKGVVHRDLKPANVKITPDGVVKVLDFGLAKAMEPAGAGLQTGLNTNSPTLSLAATQAGMILGTAAYMSPEQAKGAEADQRSDVFSFGCVLYEMLTGRQAFQADTAAETMAAVLMREPDLTALSPNLNPKLTDLLRRCLAKSPKARWQAVGDLRLELEAISADPRGATLTPHVALQPLWKRAIPITATATVVGAAASFLTWWSTRPVISAPLVTRFSVTLPEDVHFTRSFGVNLAVSPDGTRIAYAANRQLYVRAIGDLEATPVSGTANLDPGVVFFSPDGQWIGFKSAAGVINKIAVSGGAPLALYKFGQSIAAGDFQGPHWGGDQILFAQAGKGVMRISANGGEPELLIQVKESEQVYGPQLLPGGKALLFTVATEPGASRWDKAQIVAQSLPSGERKVLVRGGGAAQYVPTGHIVYALGNTLLAIAFDVDTLEVRGGPVPIVEGVRRATALNTSGAAQFDLSATGSLVYIPGSASTIALRTLALADRNGRIEPLGLPAQTYRHPRISPDGKRMAFETDDGTNAIVWVAELKPGATPRRLTFGGRNVSPVWSRDGRFIVFQSDREGDRSLFRQQADGTGTVERLTKADAGIEHRPEDWTPDGRSLSFMVGGSGDIWTVSLDGDHKPRPLVQLPSNERYSAFSPDGRWFAYTSTEVGGNFEVFVQPFPPTGAKYQISTGGGRDPLWSPDGRQIYYDTVNGGDGNLGDLLSIEVRTQPVFSFGPPTPLPIKQALLGGQGRYYDITPDGQRFLVVVPASAQSGPARQPAEQINVVLNWFEELKTRVPATR